MQRITLQKTLEVLLLLVLLFAGLYYAKPFLVPVCIAGLLSMLFLPVCRRIETIGLKRGLAVLLCILLFLLIISGMVWVIIWQVSSLADEIGNIKQEMNSLMQQVKGFLARTFGISLKEQQEAIEQQTEGANGFIVRLTALIPGILVHFVLTLVYIFLFMYYRTHIKKFIAQVIPKKEDANTEDALDDIEKVSQHYLGGIGLMIVCLWVMYSIGFSILGLKHAFLFAILCGLFEIVPFVGNLVGNGLAILMAITQGGGMPLVIGIIITYAIVQFLQSYILEPLVVGNEVNLNPLFTIMALVVGELLWGIAGLVLAIPLMGIVKIICDHIPSLKPYGFLIGREKRSGPGLLDRIKKMFAGKGKVGK